MYFYMAEEKTHSPRIQRRRANKINSMLDASMKIIFEQGLSCLTMRNLADVLDITPGALYRYFPSKGHIIGALGNRTLNSYAEALKKGVEKTKKRYASEEPALRSLLCILAVDQEYMGLSLRSYENYRILNMIMVDEKRFMTEKSDYNSFMMGAVELLKFTATQYEDASVKGALEDGNSFDRALCLLALLHGSLQLVKFSEEMPQFVEPGRVHQTFLRSHLLGFGAQKEMVEKAFSLFYS